MTDPEERIVEIEERLEAWPDDGALVVYAPDDIPYLLEVAKAARYAEEVLTSPTQGLAGKAKRDKERARRRLHDALHNGGGEDG